jgi:uncharacterized Zn-finger protein
MRIHEGIKPYKCELCGICFTTHGHLSDHMRSHSGERPFKCEICGSTFIRSSTLKTHQKRHTEEELATLEPVQRRRSFTRIVQQPPEEIEKESLKKRMVKSSLKAAEALFKAE